MKFHISTVYGSMSTLCTSVEMNMNNSNSLSDLSFSWTDAHEKTTMRGKMLQFLQIDNGRPGDYGITSSVCSVYSVNCIYGR